MNKKGFTLVELLAVIVLLTMVGVFSVSVILEKNDEKRDQIDSATKELIITAAKNYVSKNSASFEPKSGNTYCLDLKEVLTKEDIENINANSNKEITLTNNKVKVTYSQNNINYDVVNDCQENVDTLPNAPVLASNMIAIKWDQNNNIVVADQNKYGDWYNYEEKRWANAIVVPKEKLAKYKSLQAGELILPFNEIDDNLIDKIIVYGGINDFVSNYSDEQIIAGCTDFKNNNFTWGFRRNLLLPCAGLVKIT